MYFQIYINGEKWKYDSSWKTSKWDAYAGNSLNLQLVSLILKGSLFPLVTLTSLTFFSWAPPPPSFFFFLCIFCYRPMFQCFMLFKPNISFYTVRNFLSPIFPSIPSSILPFISPHSPPPPVCPPASQRNGQGLSSISGMHRMIPQITRVHTAVADITGGKGSWRYATPVRVNNTNLVCFEYRGLGWYYEHEHRVCWYFEHDHRVCWYFDRAVGILKW